jgi:hypothetical protein
MEMVAKVIFDKKVAKMTEKCLKIAIFGLSMPLAW